MENGQDIENEVVATLAASAPRRMMGIVVLGLLGGLLIYAGLAQPQQMIAWQLALIVAGGGTLFMAERMRRASVVTLELTRNELRERGGQVLARLDQIEAVNRGAFAIKPSNGFVLVTRQPQMRRWAPGLWWRLGRRIGVGGVTPPSQTKFMAEMIQVLLTERDGGFH